MVEYTPNKVKMEFLKALKAVTPITKEIFEMKTMNGKWNSVGFLMN